LLRGKAVATEITIGRLPYPAAGSARPGIPRWQPPVRSAGAALWTWRSSASARSPRLPENSQWGQARAPGRQRRCNAPVHGGLQGKADRQHRAVMARTVVSRGPPTRHVCRAALDHPVICRLLERRRVERLLPPQSRRRAKGACGRFQPSNTSWL
jgi:hypothetical protein